MYLKMCIHSWIPEQFLLKLDPDFGPQIINCVVVFSGEK
jgi:hypothetical protein